MLSPLNFGAGILVVAGGVLLYTLWSGFRASVLTDFAQVVAMLGAAVVVIPIVFFAAGGPGMFEAGVAAGHVTPQQESFFSSEAFMNQGAPYIAAVLAYAIGNQTIAQRLFAVREDLIRPTFVTAMVGYADGYGQSVGRRAADPRTMLLIGRLTMIVATAAALYFATSQFNILDLLVFVGALWGCLVFPVIASFYWPKVTNAAFTVSVLAALAFFLPVRFGWLPAVGAWGLVVELLATLGIGVVLGIMAFGFFGLRPAGRTAGDLTGPAAC